MNSATAAKRRATSYDVARQAGVSQSTVSRCFHGDSAISPETRDHVLTVARALGYVPNALARGLITRQSNMVGFIATRYTLRGNPEVTYAIGEALAAAGKQLLLVTAERDAPPIADLRGALDYPLDGLISCVALTDDAIRYILDRHIAVVLYNRHSHRIPVDAVTANHYFAAAGVASALHGAGHRRFLCLSGPADAPVSRERRDGFMQRLVELGVTDTPLLETDFSYAGGRDGFLHFVAQGGRPDAVFCANDQIALGVLDACRYQLGLKVPDEISVVGFDDVPEAGRPCYDLTTVHQDTLGMAQKTVELLLLRLAAPDMPVMHAQSDASFIARGSARLTATH